MASNNDIYKSLLNQIKLEDEDENIQSKNKDVFTFNSQNDVNSVLTKILSENTSSSEVGFNNEPLTSKIKELLFSNKETCTKEIEDIFFENVENHTAVMEKILNNKDTNIDHDMLQKYIEYRKLNLIYLKDNLRYVNVYYKYLDIGYLAAKKIDASSDIEKQNKIDILKNEKTMNCDFLKKQVFTGPPNDPFMKWKSILCNYTLLIDKMKSYVENK
jgi:hypothetical protein